MSAPTRFALNRATTCPTVTSENMFHLTLFSAVKLGHTQKQKKKIQTVSLYWLFTKSRIRISKCIRMTLRGSLGFSWCLEICRRRHRQTRPVSQHIASPLFSCVSQFLYLVPSGCSVLRLNEHENTKRSWLVVGRRPGGKSFTFSLCRSGRRCCLERRGRNKLF